MRNDNSPTQQNAAHYRRALEQAGHTVHYFGKAHDPAQATGIARGTGVDSAVNTSHRDLLRG